MVWHIWWMAIALGVGMGAAIVARTHDDDAEYCLPASAVEKIEEERNRELARSARTRTANDPILSSQPLPETLT